MVYLDNTPVKVKMCNYNVSIHLQSLTVIRFKIHGFDIISTDNMTHECGM